MTKNTVIAEICEPNRVQVPPEIEEARKANQLVMFIGNGLSRLYGLPSWDDLPDQMLQEVWDKKIIEYIEFDQLKKLDKMTKLSISSTFFKENKISLKKTLEQKEPANEQYNEAIRRLCHHARSIATTNYDKILYDILNSRTNPKATTSAARSNHNMSLDNNSQAQNPSRPPKMFEARVFEEVCHPKKINETGSDFNDKKFLF